ncbi:MAG: hypothetical protein PHG08_00880 [Bacilli bacterium]|nr:hypothetical protein [Bacilli bacterium]
MSITIDNHYKIELDKAKADYFQSVEDYNSAHEDLCSANNDYEEQLANQLFLDAGLDMLKALDEFERLFFICAKNL